MPPPIPERRQEASKKTANKEYRAEELKSPADKIREQQESRLYTESWDDFSDELTVEVALGKGPKRKDAEKPGGQGERGEDSYLADKETGLTGVFDGLGGEGAGAEASVAAALHAPTYYKVFEARAAKNQADTNAHRADLLSVIEAQASFKNPNEQRATAESLKNLWGKAPAEVRKEIIALYNTVAELSKKVRETEGKTTATIGKTVSLPDGRVFEVVANVGDSGALKIDKDGKPAERTEEDSALDDFVTEGHLSAEDARNPKLSVITKVRENLLKQGQPAANVEKYLDAIQAGFRKKPGEDVTVADVRVGTGQALGSSRGVKPRVQVFELKPGDKIAYLSDGILDVISDKSGDFDKTRAAKLAEGGAEALLRETNTADAAREKPKNDDKAILIKERVQTIESVNEEEEPIEELGEEDIEELREAK